MVAGHETEPPEWYRERHGDADPVTFAEAVRDLPQVVETTVAYQNPYTDEWVETERFNALVEPSRAREQARDGDAETDPLFHVPTDSYSIINPVDVYGPLEEVLREETIDGTPLDDVMFGEIRRYRGGGEVHMDVIFDGLEVRLPGRSEPITMGVTSGYDFFDEHAVYVEGFAQDGYCSNTMRSLADTEVIEHVGDVRELRGVLAGDHRYLPLDAGQDRAGVARNRHRLTVRGDADAVHRQGVVPVWDGPGGDGPTERGDRLGLALE